MEKAVKKIHALRHEHKLTSVQALSLISMKLSIYDLDITGEELFDLRKQGYINGNKLTAKSHEILDELFARKGAKKVAKRAYNAKKPVMTVETA